MSMYSDLLAVAVRTGISADHERPSADDLLAHLRHCRGRLTADAAAPPAFALSSVAGDLAVQLEYDLTLILLCSVLGIDHDVARFDQPVLEREHLELALSAQGVNLAGTRAVPR